MFEDISKVVLVTDMDGTLLNSKKEVTPKDRKAIEYFMSLGGRFTVATGRTIQSFSHYYDLLDLRFPVIMFNGSVIYDKSFYFLKRYKIVPVINRYICPSKHLCKKHKINKCHNID